MSIRFCWGFPRRKALKATLSVVFYILWKQGMFPPWKDLRGNRIGDCGASAYGCLSTVIAKRSVYHMKNGVRLGSVFSVNNAGCSRSKRVRASKDQVLPWRWRVIHPCLRSTGRFPVAATSFWCVPTCSAWESEARMG